MNSLARPLLLTICCTITGFALGFLGALIVLAQFLEWWSFGNWNPVSVGYALDYFRIDLPYFAPTALGKVFNWLGDKFSDLPLSLILLGIGGLLAGAGIKHAQRKVKTADEETNLGVGRRDAPVREEKP